MPAPARTPRCSPPPSSSRRGQAPRRRGCRAVGVDLDDVSAEFVRISNIAVTGEGRGVEMERVQTRGGIVVEGVTVDARPEPDGP